MLATACIMGITEYCPLVERLTIIPFFSTDCFCEKFYLKDMNRSCFICAVPPPPPSRIRRNKIQFFDIRFRKENSFLFFKERVLSKVGFVSHKVNVLLDFDPLRWPKITVGDFVDYFFRTIYKEKGEVCLKVRLSDPKDGIKVLESLAKKTFKKLEVEISLNGSNSLFKRCFLKEKYILPITKQKVMQNIHGISQCS